MVLRKGFLACCSAVFSLGIFAGGAVAQTALPTENPSPYESSSVSLHYAVYVHGFHALNADGAYALRDWGYGGTTRLYTVGIASWFLTIDLTSTIEGHFKEDGSAAPIFYDAHGFSRKKQRNLHISFGENGPHIDLLTPKDDERDPLPEDKLKHSIDLLSGLGVLFHTLETTGKCNLSGDIFDGLRLTHIDAYGPEIENIPQEHDIYFSGPAKKCSFTGKQIAGFVKDSKHKALLSAPQPGAAWFVHLDHIGIVPVRIDFQHPKLGHIIMVMQKPPEIAQVTTHNPLQKK